MNSYMIYWDIARILSVSCYFNGYLYILKYYIRILRRVYGVRLWYSSYFRYIFMKCKSNVTRSLNKFTKPNKYSISSGFCFMYSNNIFDKSTISFFSPISWTSLYSNLFNLFCIAWLRCFKSFSANAPIFLSQRLFLTASSVIISKKVR